MGSNNDRRQAWLALKAQSGDREALGALLEGCQEGLYRCVESVVGPDAAGDVLQDVLIRICRKLHHLRDPMAFRAWSFRLAARAAIRHARRTRKAGGARTRSRGTRSGSGAPSDGGRPVPAGAPSACLRHGAAGESSGPHASLRGGPLTSRVWRCPRAAGRDGEVPRGVRPRSPQKPNEGEHVMSENPGLDARREGGARRGRTQ